MDQIKGFVADNQEIILQNNKAVVNLTLAVFYDDNGDDVIFDFPGYISAYMRVYDTLRRTRLIKNFTSQITRNSNVLIFNCSVSDMTFDDAGRYYFEIGYVNSGYDISIRYGQLTIIP